MGCFPSRESKKAGQLHDTGRQPFGVESTERHKVCLLENSSWGVFGVRGY